METLFSRFTAASYGGLPFPHAVIDGVFSDQLINGVLREFPGKNSEIWHNVDNDVEKKSRTKWTCSEDLQGWTRYLVQLLLSGTCLRALTKLTGIEHLISDPYLSGGGLNCIYKGGYLDIHCDGNWHPVMGVHRRMNVILYLNDSDGDLELWGKTKTKITPKRNRMVVFETNDKTFHGHPEPLKSETRKSLILYYYTAPKPVFLVPHRALWRSRGEIAVPDTPVLEPAASG